MATSASDRYDAARQALAAFENATPANGKNDNDRYALAKEMAAALRALIEPAAVEETPEDAELLDIFNQAHYRAVREVAARRVEDGGGAARRAGRRALFHAGIQAAWNTWEPDDYAEANS